MPRATACSSSTMRMVAATRRCYTGVAPTAASSTHARAAVVPSARRSGRLAPAGPAVEPQPVLDTTTHHPEVRFHAHRRTARPTLAAEHREITGKAVKRLRQEGRLPGVVYGHGVGSTNVSVDTHEFDQLRRHVGSNALVDLSSTARRRSRCWSTSVQIHPVHRRPLHVDLFLVTMTEELTVDVPLVALGEAPAATLGGGTLLHPIETSGSGRCPTTCRSPSNTTSRR